MSANEHFVKLFVQHSEFNLLENGALEELSRSFWQVYGIVQWKIWHIHDRLQAKLSANCAHFSPRAGRRTDRGHWSWLQTRTPPHRSASADLAASCSPAGWCCCPETEPATACHFTSLLSRCFRKPLCALTYSSKLLQRCIWNSSNVGLTDLSRSFFPSLLQVKLPTAVLLLLFLFFFWHLSPPGDWWHSVFGGVQTSSISHTHMQIHIYRHTWTCAHTHTHTHTNRGHTVSVMLSGTWQTDLTNSSAGLLRGRWEPGNRGNSADSWLLLLRLPDSFFWIFWVSLNHTKTHKCLKRG